MCQSFSIVKFFIQSYPFKYPYIKTIESKLDKKTKIFFQKLSSMFNYILNSAWVAVNSLFNTLINDWTDSNIGLHIMSQIMYNKLHITLAVFDSMSI